MWCKCNTRSKTCFIRYILLISLCILNEHRFTRYFYEMYQRVIMEKKNLQIFFVWLRHHFWGRYDLPGQNVSRPLTFWKPGLLLLHFWSSVAEWVTFQSKGDGTQDTITIVLNFNIFLKGERWEGEDYKKRHLWYDCTGHWINCIKKCSVCCFTGMQEKLS